MFDIGFLEILVVLIIALLVIGPERMPELARKIGQFTGKMRRFVNSMKEDSQVQETLRELHDSINLEEEKKQIDSLGTELQNDLNGGIAGGKNSVDELDMEQFQRPFGGDANQGGSQFNRAPAQPEFPKPEKEKTPSTANAESNTQQPSSSTTQADVETSSQTTQADSTSTLAEKLPADKPSENKS